MKVRTLVIATAIFLMVLPSVMAELSSETTNEADWTTFGRSLNHSFYTPGYAPPNISLTSSQTYTDLGLFGYYPPAISNDTLYFGENGNYFHVLNASNISLVINKRVFDDSSLSPTIAGDSVYVGTDTLVFYQLNSSDTNQTLATANVPGSNGNAFYGAAVTDGYLYATTGNDGRFYQFNATNISQEIASYYLGSRTYSGPAIANGYAYILNSNGKLYQFNATNISILEASISIAGFTPYGSPAATEEYVYVGSDNFNVYQLNASNVSEVIATYVTGGVVYGAPGVAHGYVYIGSNDKSFYQLNASNISIQVANYTGTSGFLNEVAVNDLYLFTTDNTNLYQFDAFDVSTLIGSVPAGSNLGGGPVIANGYVYQAGGTSRKLTQFGSELPVVTLNAPADNYEFGASVINLTFTCTGSDSVGIQNLSLYLSDNANSSFLLNQSDDLSGKINSSSWSMNLDDGTYTWNCVTYDSDGNEAWGNNRTMDIDTTPPILVIDSPSNVSFSGDIDLDIVYTVTDPNLDSCWYSNDTLESNTTLVDCADITDVVWDEGVHNVTIWANDTRGNGANTDVEFTIDVTIPAFVDVTNQSIEFGVPLNYSINVTDLNGVSCFIVNDTNMSMSCAGILSNNTLLEIGIYNLNITVNDTSGNKNSTQLEVNVSDSQEPAFTGIENVTVYDWDGVANTLNATDVHGVECFTINDSNFQINCTGYLENATSLLPGLYNLNVSINDSSSNVNHSAFWVNVTYKPVVGLDIVTPLAATNATQNALFSITVNVSCTRDDCGDINISLSHIYENTSDVSIAFVCYSSGCSDANNFTDYLDGEGFTMTENVYTSWTDANLNQSSYDVMVVGGNHLVGYYAFDSAADPARDAFEDERMPTVVALDTGYTPSNLGITTTTCTTDSSEDNITDIQSHNIMTGFEGVVGVTTSGDDVCYYSTSQMNDPYTKLFAPEDAGSAYISGFVVEEGDATVGTDPGNFVFLGFDTADNYPTGSGNDATIIKQAICWAGSGSYDCMPSRSVNDSISASPFYANMTNPYTVSLTNDSSIEITFLLNATGSESTVATFSAMAEMVDDVSISNTSLGVNISIVSAIEGPVVSIAYPQDEANYTNEITTLNYTVTSDNALDKCWWTNSSGMWNSSVVSAGTNFSGLENIEGWNNWTVYCNDSSELLGTANTDFFTDFTLPTFTSISNQSVEYGDNFGVEINATDNNEIDCFGVNDSNFQINCTGYLFNSTTINVSVNWLNITINDTVGNEFSELMSVSVLDTTAPIFTTLENQTSNVGASFVYDIDATDSYSFSCFRINDSTNFQINCSGYLQNTVDLTIGIYNLNVTINDSSDNEASSTLSIQVVNPVKAGVMYTPPTPANTTYQREQFVEVNVSINHSNLQELTWTWNGSNYSRYNESLVLMYNFDSVTSIGENSTYIVDQSIYGFNGTGEVGVVLNESGKWGGGAQFDGSDDYIDATDLNFIDGAVELSGSVWVKISDLTDDGTILAKDVFGTNSQLLLWRDEAGASGRTDTFSVLVGTGVAEQRVEGASGIANDDAWHHVAFTYKGGSSTGLRLYIDGKEDPNSGTSTTSVTTLASNSNSLLVGKPITTSGKEFTGAIDELRLWNRTLDANDIYQEYISNLHKIDSTSWSFYINQSENTTELLGDGNYTFQVFVSNGVVDSNSSEQRTVTIDGTPPVFDIFENQSREFDEGLLYELNVTDASDIGCFTVNDTNFAINCSGYVQNATEVQQGLYTLNITVNDSLGNEASSLFDVNITNTLLLRCEVGGPYQQDAVVLFQGNTSNGTSVLANIGVNLTVYDSSQAVTYSTNLSTSDDGTFETILETLLVGSYSVNVTAAYESFTKTCLDTLDIGGPASLVLDKIATIHNLTNSSIGYNITLRLINNGGSNATSANITEHDSPNSPYILGDVGFNESVERSYVLEFTRNSTTYLFEPRPAEVLAIDPYTSTVISTNSTDLNITIPEATLDEQLTIIKNAFYNSENSTTVNYSITLDVVNSGGVDLESITLIDSDLGVNTLIAVNRTGNYTYSNTISIEKAASNTNKLFVKTTATSNAITYSSNQIQVRIPGYGGPADTIVYAPPSVAGSSSVSSTIQVLNANADIGQDFTVDYWITNNDETVNYTAGQQTVYVSAQSDTNISVTLTAPSGVGVYRLRAFTSWVGGTATAFDSFSVTGEEGPVSSEGGSSSGGGGGIITPSIKIDVKSGESKEFTIPHEGIIKTISQGGTIAFNFLTAKDVLEMHNITVKHVQPGSALIVVASTPREFVLDVGESISLDLNDDDILDVRISLISVKATVTKYAEISVTLYPQFDDKIPQKEEIQHILIQVEEMITLLESKIITSGLFEELGVLRRISYTLGRISVLAEEGKDVDALVSLLIHELELLELKIRLISQENSNSPSTLPRVAFIFVLILLVFFLYQRKSKGTLPVYPFTYHKNLFGKIVLKIKSFWRGIYSRRIKETHRRDDNDLQLMQDRKNLEAAGFRIKLNETQVQGFKSLPKPTTPLNIRISGETNFEKTTNQKSVLRSRRSKFTSLADSFFNNVTRASIDLYEKTASSCIKLLHSVLKKRKKYGSSSVEPSTVNPPLYTSSIQEDEKRLKELGFSIHSRTVEQKKVITPMVSSIKREVQFQSPKVHRVPAKRRFNLVEISSVRSRVCSIASIFRRGLKPLLRNPRTMWKRSKRVHEKYQKKAASAKFTHHASKIEKDINTDSLKSVYSKRPNIYKKSSKMLSDIKEVFHE